MTIAIWKVSARNERLGVQKWRQLQIPLSDIDEKF